MELKEKLNKILNRRSLFSIDAAIGYNHIFLNNSFQDNHFGRFGTWLTLNYSQLLNRNAGNQMYLNLYASGRYLSDATTFENNRYVRQNYFDVGGKIEYEYNKFSAACEYLYRFNNVENTFRCVGSLKYQLKEQFALTCSFGKNFGVNNNLVSFLGLNWGLNFGKEKVNVKK